MHILALEASGQVAGAAIVNETITVAETSVNRLLNHSETLMPLVEAALSAAGMTLADMDFIAASSGPGSFTGLRIGAATAKGLAHGAGKAMIAVPTLDALAYNIFGAAGMVVPVMDARRGQVYTALYRWEAGELIKLTDDLAEDMAALFERVKRHTCEAVFTGDGVFVHERQITEAGFHIAPPNVSMQRAASVGALAVKLAKAGIVTDFEHFAPAYLRLPQAERELIARQKEENK